MDSIKYIFTVAGPVYETVQKNLNLLFIFLLPCSFYLCFNFVLR